MNSSHFWKTTQLRRKAASPSFILPGTSTQYLSGGSDLGGSLENFVAGLANNQHHRNICYISLPIESIIIPVSSIA